MLVRDVILMQYNPLSHWLWLELEDWDFSCVIDDFGNMVVINEDAMLYSLLGYVSI